MTLPYNEYILTKIYLKKTKQNTAEGSNGQLSNKGVLLPLVLGQAFMVWSYLVLVDLVGCFFHRIWFHCN
jgi:hypothetical protein